MRAGLILFTLLLPAAAAAAPSQLEQPLAKVGLKDVKTEESEDGVRLSCTYAERSLDEPALRKALIAAMVALREAHGSAKRAAIDVALADNQVMQISGDPRLFHPDMDEVRFLRSARVRFLTRGPTLTPGPCPPKASCKLDPEHCPCEPGSLCEPEDDAADDRGCISVRATQNAEARGGGSVCKPGHTWDPKGFDCVPEPHCGAGLGHGGACVCPPGVEQNSAGGCGPLPVVAPDSGPPRLDAGVAPAEAGPAAPAAPSNTTGFPRWVWQAMAGGVVLSVPIALFLLGSILGSLRSRRSRIGLRKYCIHCGRKLAMEDTWCRKCKTEQP